MAAVNSGFQNPPFNDQRSVIALRLTAARGYHQLLNDAVNDSGKRAAMFGSVAVIRGPAFTVYALAISITSDICRVV